MTPTRALPSPPARTDTWGHGRVTVVRLVKIKTGTVHSHPTHPVTSGCRESCGRIDCRMRARVRSSTKKNFGFENAPFQLSHHLRGALSLSILLVRRRGFRLDANVSRGGRCRMSHDRSKWSYSWEQRRGVSHTLSTHDQTQVQPPESHRQAIIKTVVLWIKLAINVLACTRTISLYLRPLPLQPYVSAENQVDIETIFLFLFLVQNSHKYANRKSITGAPLLCLLERLLCYPTANTIEECCTTSHFALPRSPLHTDELSLPLRSAPKKT